MRSLPLVLVLFWFYFLVPYIGMVIGASRPISVGPFTSALVTFVMFEAAYFARSCAPAYSRSPRVSVPRTRSA